MRIAQLAPLVESVPPQAYGGIELVVSLLTEGLIARGHQVTLFASGESKTEARLVSVLDQSLRNNPTIKPHLWTAYDYQSLLELQSMKDQFDIVHNHMGWQALPMLADLGIPVVTTNHNLIEPAVRPVFQRYRTLPYIGISRSYVRRNGGDFLNYIDVVYNGIDIQAYRYSPDTSRQYLCFLGRLCHDKGIVEAITIAKRLGVKLVIAGKVDPSDRDYFKQEVAHLLNHPLVEYIGEVGHEGKVKLFSGALALVYPINFEEPFGLVMIEALSCGVPVLALNRGSVREVLNPETAVIAKSVDELIANYPGVLSKSRTKCRHRVESLFSSDRMVEGYERAYNAVLTDRQSMTAKVPVKPAVLPAAQVVSPRAVPPAV